MWSGHHGSTRTLMAIYPRFVVRTGGLPSGCRLALDLRFYTHPTPRSARRSPPVVRSSPLRAPLPPSTYRVGCVTQGDPTRQPGLSLSPPRVPNPVLPCVEMIAPEIKPHSCIRAIKQQPEITRDASVKRFDKASQLLELALDLRMKPLFRRCDGGSDTEGVSFACTHPCN